MENDAFKLVKQILKSSLFLTQTTDQQQATLDEIIATGEITKEEVFKLINETSMIMNNENHLVLFEFFQTISGEMFIKGQDDNINGPWIVKIYGRYYDDNGILTNLRNHGRDISMEKLADMINYKDGVTEEVKSKYNSLTKIFFGYQTLANQSILNQLERILGYTEITSPLEAHEGRIYLIRQNGELRIMRLFDPSEVDPNSPEDLIAIHHQFSDLGITPHVYASGVVYPENGGQGTVYVVMDYIPTTLRDISDRQEQIDAVRQAIRIGYEIESLGYYGIDDHAGNFLYDPATRKVFAIDLAGLTRTPNQSNQFSGKIRDLDII